MTLLTGAVVTAVVWAISLVRSVRLRALIYSLPVPITLVLLTTRLPVSAQQVVGVVLLNVFVATVAWTHQRLRWHILLADLAGVAVYIAASWALLSAGHLPFAPVLVAALGIWTVVVAWSRRTHRRQPAPAEQVVPAEQAIPAGFGLRLIGKLAILALGAMLMVVLGRLLQGMIVTFPYAGVLVVVETRQDPTEFRDHFARNSLALLAFVACYYLAQDVSPYLAVAAGFAGFLCCAVLLTGWAGRRLPRAARR